MGRLVVLALLLGAVGCTRAEIDVDADLSAVTGLSAGWTMRVEVRRGADVRSDRITLTAEVALARAARFVYRTRTTGAAELILSVEDEAGACRGAGQVQVSPAADKAVYAPVTVTPGGCAAVIGDMSVGVEDLAGDMTGPPEGVTRCPGSFAFCEPFEPPVIDTARWFAPVEPGVSSRIDATRARRGNGSLHLHFDAGPFDSGTYAHPRLITTAFPAMQTTYARLFVYLSASTPQLPNSSALLTLSQNVNPFGGAFVYLFGRTPGVGSYTPSTDAVGSNPIRTGEWVCVEWKIEHGAPDGGEMRAWVNDKIEAAALVTPFRIDPLPNQMKIGIEINLPSWAAFDVWFDELVLDGKPIGCAN